MYMYFELGLLFIFTISVFHFNTYF